MMVRPPGTRCASASEIRSARRVSILRFAVAVGVVGAVLMSAAAANAGSAGQLDRSFGSDGNAVFESLPGAINSVDMASRNRTVVAGSTGDAHFTVARLTPRGHLDQSFSDDGVTKVSFEGASAGARAIVVRPNDAAVVAGSVAPESQSDVVGFGVARVLPTGRLDRSFGTLGRTEVLFGNRFVEVVALAVDGERRIVLAGNICHSDFNGDCQIALARLTPRGRIDRSFGNDGTLVSSLAQPGKACRHTVGAGRIHDMAVDSRDRIVVGGYCRRGVGLARFKPNGHVDRSFGDNGRIDKDYPSGAVDALAIDRRGRIDVTGGKGYKFLVARFGPRGRLDRDFGNDGTSSVVLPDGSPGCSSLVIDSRGRIIVGGHTYRTSANVGDIARFGRNGHVDRRFGDDGLVVLDRRTGLGVVNSVSTDSRDRIIGAGYHRTGRITEDFAVTRLLG
jgi:uncharacterized delta-60 repeat protein